MERKLKMIAASVVILAAAVVFGTSSIALSISGAGPLRSSDGEVAALWGIFAGVVLLVLGLVLMFRRDEPGSVGSFE